LIKRIALLLVSIALTTLAVDLASRSIYDRWVLVRPTAIYKNRWPVDLRLNRYDANVSFADDIIGGMALMVPGEPTPERHVEFITDAHGFRNLPEALQRENSLLLVGDSFGAGSATTQEETLSAIFSRDYGLANYNLSVAGHSPSQEFMTLQYEFERIPKSRDATIVWLLFEGNDLDDPPIMTDPRAPNGWFAQLRIRLEVFFARSPIQQSIERLATASKRSPFQLVLSVPHDGQTMLFFKSYLLTVDRTLQEVNSHKNYRHFVAIFERMSEFARVSGHPLMVVLIPTKERVYEWIATGSPAWSTKRGMSAFGRSIKQLARAEQVEYVDLLPVFRRESKRLYRDTKKYLYWADDTHWNAEGQALGARTIAQRLRTMGL
jgi:hypothetical protein